MSLRLDFPGPGSLLRFFKRQIVTAPLSGSAQEASFNISLLLLTHLPAGWLEGQL